MKVQNLLFIIIVIIALSGVATYIITDHLVSREVNYIPFDFGVVQKGAGFNLDKDKFHFGDIPLKGYAHRNINVNNSNPFREKAVFFIGSNVSIGKWFKFTPNSGYIIEPGTVHTFKVSIFPPENASLQMYEGAIIVKLYKAWPWETYTEDMVLNLEETAFTSNGFKNLR
jgi:hypothetical protein